MHFFCVAKKYIQFGAIRNVLAPYDSGKCQRLNCFITLYTPLVSYRVERLRINDSGPAIFMVSLSRLIVLNLELFNNLYQFLASNKLSRQISRASKLIETDKIIPSLFHLFFKERSSLQRSLCPFARKVKVSRSQFLLI